MEGNVWIFQFFSLKLWPNLHGNKKKATFVWNSNLVIIFPPFFLLTWNLLRPLFIISNKDFTVEFKSKRKRTLTGRCFWTKERTKILNWGEQTAHEWLSTASTQEQTWELLQYISDTRTLKSIQPSLQLWLGHGEMHCGIPICPKPPRVTSHDP